MPKSGFQQLADTAQHYANLYRPDLSAEEMADLFETFMEEIDAPFIDACGECGGDSGYVELVVSKLHQAGIHAMADVRASLANPVPAFTQRDHGTHNVSNGRAL
jgi:hypothetical protein